MKETYLYFRTQVTNADDDGRSDSACFPASSLVSMQPIGDSALAIDFSVDGVSSSVILNLTTANTHSADMQAISNVIVNRGAFGMITIANDKTGATKYLANSGIASCGTITAA